MCVVPGALTGGRSAQIDARANRWDAQEYESLKAERERLKRDIDVSTHTYIPCCRCLVLCHSLLLVGKCTIHKGTIVNAVVDLRQHAASHRDDEDVTPAVSLLAVLSPIVPPCRSCRMCAA